MTKMVRAKKVFTFLALGNADGGQKHMVSEFSAIEARKTLARQVVRPEKFKLHHIEQLVLNKKGRWVYQR